ncbi:MAG: hypothetical protein SFZ24_04870 [Planctomycetota bacterium]|nr:hypothetical protein [Planctomycetota bacterium]
MRHRLPVRRSAAQPPARGPVLPEAPATGPHADLGARLIAAARVAAALHAAALVAPAADTHRSPAGALSGSNQR